MIVAIFCELRWRSCEMKERLTHLKQCKFKSNARPRPTKERQHVRVNTRDWRVHNGLREDIIQPALGLPLFGVGAPDRAVAVACKDGHDNAGLAGDEDLSGRFTVFELDRLGRGEDDVFVRATKDTC